MPTRTTPRRSATPARAGRFSRTSTPARSTARFSRPLPVQRPAPRGRRKPKQSGGMLSTVMSALPVGGSGKKSRGRSQSSASKRGPAIGLAVAGAGALLGRRQMRKRQARDTLEHPSPGATV